MLIGGAFLAALSVAPRVDAELDLEPWSSRLR